ncbi:MAG TPA: carboxypeptidase-like regulatory domain-containing protein [Candidatus Koribacter sp.]|jgi:5-hydroxyisourate hydrolase-like protein (transthyretin family)
MIRKIALLLCLAVALPLFAEEQLAVHVNELRVPQLMGVVKNHHGDPVAGVRVEVIRRENGHTVGDAKTDDQGRFAFPNLKDARYNIKVHHNGIADFYHVRVTTEKASPELVLKFK